MSLNQSQHSIFYEYLVKGIIDSGIVEDGGLICDKEIPSQFKYTVVIISLMFHIWLFIKIKRSYKFTFDKDRVEPSLFEKLYGIVSIVIVLIQFYLKMSTKKGLFIFNPCHTNLVFVAVLMLLPTSRNSKLIHLVWEPWIFGPIFALLFPHLYGINEFEIYIYYIEHFLIFPFGQLLLTRRYGGLEFPSLKNQLFGFGTMAIYQYGVLTGLSDITKVNLNFTLCHSPADASFDIWGYWYFFFGQIYLNIASYVFIIIMWPVKNLFYWIFFKSNGKKELHT